MRLLPLLPLLALLACLPQLVPAVTEISFQAHSYNDLRQWPSLILKGATWVKVDFNYATPTFCQTPSLATSRVRNGTRGCFLLNHDPLSLYRTSGYNTSDDVLDFVESLASSPFLHSPRNVSIALCHKFDYGGVCRNTSDALNWQSLMAAFYTRAQSLITRHNLSLIFVEDGSGAIDPSSPCLTELFLGWPSTYIPDENNAAGLFRNDTPTFARMNLLNIQQTSFYNVSSLRYGKFPSSPYPFLLWEPSDQPTLDNYTRHYLEGLRHPPGFRYAINIDPVQFAVYTGNASGDAWNQRRPELLGRASPHPLTVAYSGVHYLVVLSTKAVGGRGDDGYTLTVYAVDALLSRKGLQYTSTLPLTLPAEAQGQVETFTLVSGEQGTTPMLFIVVQGNETLSVLLIPVPTLASWRALKPAFSRSFPVSLPSGPSASDAVWATPDTVWSVRVVADGASADVHVYSVNVTSGETAEVATMSLDVGGVSVAGLAVAAVPGPYTAGDSLCAAGAMPGLLSYTLANYSAYAAYFCVSADADIQLSSAVSVSVGSTPSLSLQRSPAPESAMHFLLTLSTSYCWNTEVYNKEADAGLCDHTPQPMASTLTYSFGQLASFMRFINSQAKGNASSLICSTELLHGTYDLGGQQSAKLWVGKDEDGVERLGVMEVHEGVPSAKGEEVVATGGQVGVVPSNICGVAIPYDGLVVDAWPLPLRTQWGPQAVEKRTVQEVEAAPLAVQVAEM